MFARARVRQGVRRERERERGRVKEKTTQRKNNMKAYPRSRIGILVTQPPTPHYRQDETGPGAHPCKRSAWIAITPHTKSASTLSLLLVLTASSSAVAF